MSAEIAPFETRLGRRVADAFAMPSLCMRRACRRNEACQGNVSATGEPDCILPLWKPERRFFLSHFDAARNYAQLVCRQEKVKPGRGPERIYIQNLCLLAAIRALADLPANRGALRAYVGKMGGLPRLGPPPGNLAPLYRDFGMPADAAETSAAEEAVEGRAEDAANHAPAAADGGSDPLPEAGPDH
jgi:hypothetical protein